MIPLRLPSAGGAPDLPPGQAAISTFPKYGAGMRRTARPARRTLSIRIDGHVKTAFEVPVAELLNMKREQITADLHCVAGWSCRGLRWDSVRFGSFYETTIAPRIPPDMRVSHLLSWERTATRRRCCSKMPVPRTSCRLIDLEEPHST